MRLSEKRQRKWKRVPSPSQHKSAMVHSNDWWLLRPISPNEPRLLGQKKKLVVSPASALSHHFCWEHFHFYWFLFDSPFFLAVNCTLIWFIRHYWEFTFSKWVGEQRITMGSSQYNRMNYWCHLILSNWKKKESIEKFQLTRSSFTLFRFSF